ncbi:SCO family protein [Ideonella sp. YS5]|uniref:SCO family protein n=1 Tax=Ideonella sp. YS5 TaxID=3453714 RepID=UPI003EEE0B68
MSGSNSSDPVAAAAPDPLAMKVHGGPAPHLPADVRQRRTGGRFTALLVLLACAAPVIVSYFTYYVWRPSARNNYADLVQPTRGIPEGLGLRDLEGRPVASASLRGQWLLVVVAGGQCDRRCEDHLYAQRQLREMAGRERDRIDRVWLVVDEAPLRAPIEQAVAAGDAPAMVLRVQREALERWLLPAPGQTLEDHLYLVDPMGEWMMRAPAALDPKLFHKDLDRLLRASAFWDRPGREH